MLPVSVCTRKIDLKQALNDSSCGRCPQTRKSLSRSHFGRCLWCTTVQPASQTRRAISSALSSARLGIESTPDASKCAWWRPPASLRAYSRQDYGYYSTTQGNWLGWAPATAQHRATGWDGLLLQHNTGQLAGMGFYYSTTQGNWLG